MNTHIVSSKIFLLLVLLGAATSTAIFAAEQVKPAACAAPEYREFDFWVGDWDTFDIEANGKVAAKADAHVRVEPILDGCVLHETYEGADGLKGESFTIYDAVRKVWHQTWVTNRGQLLIIEGRFNAGEVVLSGVEHKASGRVMVRGIWKPVNEGVRETAVTSSDDGKTWKPWFDILFRRRQP